MAKKRNKKPQDEEAAGNGHRRFLRYCLIIALTGVVVLAWVSLLSYSPTDPPATWTYPPKRPVDNAAGLVGSHVAHALRYWLGAGAYMGLLFASVAAGVLMLGGRITDLPWRVIGVALMVTATSAAVHLMDPAMGGDIAAGFDGVLGKAVGHLLVSRLASIGGWLVVMAAFCAGVMLAADNIVLRLPALGRRAWNRKGDLAGALASLRPKRPEPAPAVAGASRVKPPVPTGAKPDKPAPEKEAPKPSAPSRNPPLFDRPQDDKSSRSPSPPAGRKSAGKSPGGNEYELPSADLLTEPKGGYIETQEVQAAQRRLVLQQTLDDFGVEAQVVGHQTGPVITMFEVSLAAGVKVSQVANLANDIARALAVPGVRIVSPLPGRDTIGIEVPNLEKEIVRLKELMALAPEADKRYNLPLYLGKDAGGNPIVADLAAMPHLLIAGTTGSGKSVCINSIIVAMLMTRAPENVRLILIDPKMVEMAAFEDLPHLLCPVVNDMRRAEDILEWAATKMDERYELLREAGVRNIAGFNRLSPDEIHERFEASSDEERARIPTHLPYYVIIVDELADLIMTSSKEVESHIIRIAQKARAVGIHMILATQRPSVNVVTGLIKSNMPCRISFRVASRQESRIVLDQNGADVLLGGGDMLFLQPGTSHLSRAQGTYLDDSEIRAVVKSAKGGRQVEYNAELMRLNSHAPGESDIEKDELFDKAVEVVLASQRGSVSLVQRRLAIGYSRASRIIDQMAEAGILGEYKGSQARECMITLEDWESMRESIAADQSGESSANGEPTSA